MTARVLASFYTTSMYQLATEDTSQLMPSSSSIPLTTSKLAQDIMMHGLCLRPV
jgi:hypothetical protein